MTDGNTFEVALAVVVEAQVEHHAPCVPDCTVCYPPDTTGDQKKDEGED